MYAILTRLGPRLWLCGCVYLLEALRISLLV